MYFHRRKVNSVEHAWPQWLLESVGGFDSQSATEAQFGAGSQEVSWIGPEVTVKCVCQTCNHGWMSTLEVEAKPVASFINDLALPLSAPEQSTLSRWSMKTTMVFEATSRKTFYSPEEHRVARHSARNTDTCHLRAHISCEKGLATDTPGSSVSSTIPNSNAP
jgi:hypothetical protein